MIAAVFAPSVLAANCAIAAPWYGSMKQLRKMKSPFLVTSGFVEDGVNIGIFAFCAIGAAAIERELATSPMTAWTMSCVTNLVTIVAASDASERSSCTSNSTCLPLMPPAALISSAAILIPLTEEMPKLAVVPVVDIKTPIRTLLSLPCVLQALSKLAITNEANRIRFIHILTGLEFLTNLKSEPELKTVTCL